MEAQYPGGFKNKIARSLQPDSEKNRYPASKTSTLVMYYGATAALASRRPRPTAAAPIPALDPIAWCRAKVLAENICGGKWHSKAKDDSCKE
ncbi:hypothetical protein AAE478_010652 [Parahypoxylon ruwenzoriense]